MSLQDLINAIPDGSVLDLGGATETVTDSALITSRTNLRIEDGTVSESGTWGAGILRVATSTAVTVREVTFAGTENLDCDVLVDAVSTEITLQGASAQGTVWFGVADTHPKLPAVTLAGRASTVQVGTPSFTSPITLGLIGHVANVVVGSPSTVNAASPITVVVNGKRFRPRVGNPQVAAAAGQTASPPGRTSTVLYGIAAVSAAAPIVVTLTGRASSMTVGTAGIGSTVAVTLAGRPSTAVAGSPTLSAAAPILFSVQGVRGLRDFGHPALSVTAPIVASPSGHSSTLAIGSAAVTGAAPINNVSVAGFFSGAHAGSPTFAPRTNVQITGRTSTVVIGRVWPLRGRTSTIVIGVPSFPNYQPQQRWRFARAEQRWEFSRAHTRRL